MIDDDVLVSRLQQHTGGDAAALMEALRGMPSVERAKLVREVAADEALYREGRALGLDTVDSVVRLRTIQQMRLLLAEEASGELSVTGEEVQEFYERNREAYAEPATISFSHLFYSGWDGEARASAALEELRSGRTIREETGDRFLYQTAYAEAGAEAIASQFGIGFLDALMPQEPVNDWQGPVRSDHGWHLVQLRKRSAAHIPPLIEVEPRVREEALAAKRSTMLDQAIDALLARYEVEER
jgi:hypothetical protein